MAEDDDEKMLDLESLGDKKKKKKIVDETFRLEFNLFEPTKDKCPEVDFCQLVKEQTGKDFTFECPSEESDERKKLKAIAQKFEEKYGPQRDKKGKKFQFGKPEDYMDLGMGYDKTDEFIDDTENYDELIPSTITTQKGGFYINHGELKFKDADDVASTNDEDSYESDSDSDSEPSRKKVRLKENGEKSRLTQFDGKKKKSTIPNLVNVRRKVEQNEIRRKSMTPNQKAGSALVKNSRNILAKKLKKSSSDLLKANYDLLMTPGLSKHVEDVVSQIAAGQASKCAAANQVVDSNIESTINELLETSVAKRGRTMDEFDILMDASKSDSESEETMKQIDDMEIKEVDPDASRQSSEDDRSGGRLVGRPPTLQIRKRKSYIIPDDVKKVIFKIQKIVFSDTNATLNWNPNGDKLLQYLFSLCKSRGFNQCQRSAVLNDLATRLRTSKMFLITRYNSFQKQERSSPSGAKPLMSNNDLPVKEPNLNELLQKLEQEVKNIMPRLEAEHNKAAEATAEKNLSSTNSMILSKSKNIYSPRRKFEWTKELKSLLTSIVQLCHESFLISSNGATSTFDKFMDESIVPQILRRFPPMWMTGKPIMKMIREVYPNVFQPEKVQIVSPTQAPVAAFFGENSLSVTQKSTNLTSTASKTVFTIDSVLSSSNQKCSQTPSPASSSRSSPGHFSKSEDVSEMESNSSSAKNIRPHFTQVKQLNEVKCYSSPTTSSSSLNVVPQTTPFSSSKVQNSNAVGSNASQTKKVTYPTDLPAQMKSDNLEKSNARVQSSSKTMTLPSKPTITVTDQSGNKDRKPQEIICNPILPHVRKDSHATANELSRKMAKAVDVGTTSALEVGPKPAPASNDLFYGVCKKPFPPAVEIKQARKTEAPVNKTFRRAATSETVEWRDIRPASSSVVQKSALDKSIENVAKVDPRHHISSTPSTSSMRSPQDNGKQDFKSPLVPLLVEKANKPAPPLHGILKTYGNQQQQQQVSPANSQTRLQNNISEPKSILKQPSISSDISKIPKKSPVNLEQKTAAKPSPVNLSISPSKFDLPTSSPTTPATSTSNRTYISAKSQEQFISKQIKSEALANVAALNNSHSSTKLNVELNSAILSSPPVSSVARPSPLSALSYSSTTPSSSTVSQMVVIKSTTNLPTQERKPVDNNISTVRYSPYKPTASQISQANSSSIMSQPSTATSQQFINYQPYGQFYSPGHSQPSISYANSLGVNLSALSSTWPATYSSQDYLQQYAGSHDGSYHESSSSSANRTSGVRISPTNQSGQNVRNFNSNNYRLPNQLHQIQRPSTNLNDNLSRTNPR